MCIKKLLFFEKIFILSLFRPIITNIYCDTCFGVTSSVGLKDKIDEQFGIHIYCNKRTRGFIKKHKIFTKKHEETKADSFNKDFQKKE